jgi:hypothetical protein
MANQPIATNIQKLENNNRRVEFVVTSTIIVEQFILKGSCSLR